MDAELGPRNLAEVSHALGRCSVDRYGPLGGFPKQLDPSVRDRRRLRIDNADGEIGCKRRNGKDNQGKNTAAEPHHSSFTRERGWCWGFAPVSWLASKDLGIFRSRGA